MNEVQLAYFEEVQEKRILARSSHNKHRPGRKPRINQISEARWRKMNSMVSKYNLANPMAWDIFKKLPHDIQAEYVNRLISEYQIGPNALGEMFGITGVTVSKYLNNNLGITFSGKASRIKRKRFIEEFCERKTTASPDEINEQAIELVPVISATAMPTPMLLQNTSLTFVGPFEPTTIVDKLASLFTSNQHVKIKIEVEVYPPIA